MFFDYNFKQKLFTDFHQIWHVVTSVNAEQCALKYSLHLTCVYTYYLIKLR